MALRAVQLVAQRGSLTVTELAAELRVAKSTAHRVLANCVAAGFVRQDAVGGPYVTGAVVKEFALTATSGVRLRDAAQAALEDLRDASGMTASVLVLEGRTARFVQSLEGHGPGRAATRLGRTLPAHCTSGGKAMLAFLPEAELNRRYPSRRLDGLTDRSITDWDVLQRALAVVRAHDGKPVVGQMPLEIAARVVFGLREEKRRRHCADGSHAARPRLVVLLRDFATLLLQASGTENAHEEPEPEQPGNGEAEQRDDV
jgi:DNA-binding IclR family transcriptional regulator